MFERAQVRALPLVGQAADLAPATQACCGVCRTCAATNLLALVGAGVAAALSRLRAVRRRD